MNDFIDVFPNALDSETCKEACKLADLTIEQGHATSVNDDSRVDYSIFIEQYARFNSIRHIILDAVHLHYHKLTQKYILSDDDWLTPCYKIQRSGPGGGFTAWHTEQGSSESSRARFMVWMIYLNTVTKGGATEFKYQEKSLQPVEGTLVMWPASYTHIHRAAPDLEENKYIATGWFEYSKRG